MAIVTILCMGILAFAPVGIPALFLMGVIDLIKAGRREKKGQQGFETLRKTGLWELFSALILAVLAAAAIYASLSLIQFTM